LVSPPGAKDPARQAIDFMQKEVPGFLAIQSVRAISVLILSIIVLVVGIGLLKLQPWGRWLALIYGAVAFLAHLIYIVFQVAVIFPAQDKFFLQVAGGFPGGNGGAFHLGRYASVGFILIVFCGHALALLIVMLLPSVAALFALPPSREERELDDDSFDEDEDYETERDDFDDDYDDRNEQRFRRR
jgi:hypothetical protein